eukprot:EG_transcript_6373
MGCCQCNANAVQEIPWAVPAGPPGAWPAWASAVPRDDASSEGRAPRSPPTPARQCASNFAELEQQYNELKARYGCSPMTRKSQLEAFLALLNANPTWQPAAWAAAGAAGRQAPSMWRFDEEDGLPDFDRHMLTLLNIVAPGRYPFETLEVVSAASEEPSSHDEGAKDAGSLPPCKPPPACASPRDGTDLCHYCADMPPAVEYVCCGHRAACFECFLKMSVLDARCPHCRASEPNIRPRKSAP